jgi:GNAT superfamily N-acetyltransferase
VTVRDARSDDLDEICSLIVELATYERAPHEVKFERDVMAGHLFGPDAVASVLIAEADDGAVAGMALWYPTFSTWVGRPGIWLEDLFVRPEHRGAGHARALLDALAERTTGRIEWSVLDWNDLAIGFYRSLGAAPVDGWVRYRLEAPEG